MREVENSIEIREGITRLIVPVEHSKKGPGTKREVFYNRQMAFNRDISVILFRAIKFKGTVADCMAGTGARGTRIANEVGGEISVTVNDSSPLAFRYIKENITINGLEGCRATCKDMHCLLAKRSFDYVDIDPFGTPVPYLHSGLLGTRRNGILALTATDTAPLAGSAPRVCRRRYGAFSRRCSFYHEVGLRILIGYVAREAAKFNRGVKPLLCFYSDHYYRLQLSLTEGAGNADRTLEKLGFIVYNRETGERHLVMDWEKGALGPLWVDSLKDKEVVSRMEPDPRLAEPKRVARFIPVYREELDLPFFYETAEFSSILGKSPPSLDRIIEKLRESGNASRTHISPTGFKTDLEFEEIKRIYSEAGR